MQRRFVSSSDGPGPRPGPGSAHQHFFPWRRFARFAQRRAVSRGAAQRHATLLGVARRSVPTGVAQCQSSVDISYAPLEVAQRRAIRFVVAECRSAPTINAAGHCSTSPHQTAISRNARCSAMLASLGVAQQVAWRRSTKFGDALPRSPRAGVCKRPLSTPMRRPSQSFDDAQLRPWPLRAVPRHSAGFAQRRRAASAALLINAPASFRSAPPRATSLSVVQSRRAPLCVAQ